MLDTIFDDFYRFNKEFNRFFNPKYFKRETFWPETNIYENQNEYVIVSKIPGIKKENINITFRDNSIKIEGINTEKNDKVHYHIKERKEVNFERNFLLNEKIDSDNIQAELKKGILLLKIPKSPEIKPKTISIK